MYVEILLFHKMLTFHENSLTYFQDASDPLGILYFYLKEMGRERGVGERYYTDFFNCLSFYDVTAQIYKMLSEGLGPTNKLNYDQHIIFNFFFANLSSIYSTMVFYKNYYINV